MDVEPTTQQEPAKRAGRGDLRRRLRRLRSASLPWFAIVVLTVFVGCALLAPVLPIQDPLALNMADRFAAPGFDYWLGTDALGRDILSRMVFGARATFWVATGGVLLGGTVALIAGMASGYFGGVTDSLIARGMDLMLAFPSIFFGLLFAAARGPGALSVVFAVVIVLWARMGRVVRSDVISYRERDFVYLARIYNAKTPRILFVHIFPNLVSTLMVLISINMAFVIITEASLSFLGAGIPPPTPAWGSMISDGQAYITSAWWVSLFPGAAIFLVVLALNSFGDWLRDFMDPTMQGNKPETVEDEASKIAH